MKTIGEKILGQYIWEQASYFRSDVYLEGISTSTETDMLVVDSNNKISKRAIDAITIDVSDFMTNGSDNRVVTATGADAMNAEANLIFDGSELSITGGLATSNSNNFTGENTFFTSAASLKPWVQIKNTNSNTTSGNIAFIKDKGAAGADGDDIGAIWFQADNSAQELTYFAKILAEISEADDTDEAGKLTFSVAASDGSTSSLTAGLILEGEHATGGEVDVTIGAGSASTTTIAGDLSVTTGLILDSVDVTNIQTSGESFADNDTSLMTSAAIDDAILKGGSNTTIKVLPHHFMSNEDGGANKSAQFRDDTIIGVRATHDDAELYAFVEIPIGKTATSVTVYGNDTGNVVEVFESDINAGALTDKTPGGGCVVGSACDITDVAADATNYLVIKVTITSYTNDIVYGAAVTISG
jgi:hypothetical protein